MSLTLTVIFYLTYREDTLTQCREVLLRLTRDTHPEVKYMYIILIIIQVLRISTGFSHKQLAKTVVLNWIEVICS